MKTFKFRTNKNVSEDEIGEILNTIPDICDWSAASDNSFVMHVKELLNEKAVLDSFRNAGLYIEALEIESLSSAAGPLNSNCK